MGIRNALRQRARRLVDQAYELLDRAYIPLDRGHIRRTRNLTRLPTAADRRGGKYAYAEWAHVIGIFQTLLLMHAPRRDAPRLLDVGCGTGLLALASEPYLGTGGTYVGLDVGQRDIAFCRIHYPQPQFSFVLLNATNAAYAPEHDLQQPAWPLEDASFDCVTALSVWTHFNEADAQYYLHEVRRVLKPGGTALITAFVLDQVYDSTLSYRSHELGRFHNTPQDLWIFDRSAYGSLICRHPQWAQVPEEAIAITDAGLASLLDRAGLRLRTRYSGNWKEQPGVYFQDVLILERPDE